MSSLCFKQIMFVQMIIRTQGRHGYSWFERPHLKAAVHKSKVVVWRMKKKKLEREFVLSYLCTPGQSPTHLKWVSDCQIDGFGKVWGCTGTFLKAYWRLYSIWRNVRKKSYFFLLLLKCMQTTCLLVSDQIFKHTFRESKVRTQHTHKNSIIIPLPSV